MASTFEGVIKRVVRELDHSGKLIPVDSLRSSASFQPYCLLGRKLSRSWFWKPRYKCINLSLRDILEPEAPEPDTRQSAPIHICDSTDGEVQGGGELEAAGKGKLAARASVSDNFGISVSVYTRQVDPNIWDAMKRERRLRRPEHKVLQQLRDCGNDVFVVTEVLQTQEEVTVTRTHKHEGSGQFALFGALSFQGQGQGHRSRKKTVTIPSGSVLAFQVAQLLIDPDWDVLLHRDQKHKKQRTFRPPKGDPEALFGYSAGSQLSGDLKLQSGQYLPDNPMNMGPFLPLRGRPFPTRALPTDGLWPALASSEVREDFQGLQAEVGAQAQGLRGLSRELCGRLLAGLVQVLQDEPALQTLEDKLEQGLRRGLAAPLDGPAGAVLECLVHSSGELVAQLARPVLYLVEALAVLSETQHAQLVPMLETRKLSGQVELVRSILAQSSPWQQPRDVSLTPGLLGSSWGPETPAWVLLEECGLEVQVDAPQVLWEPDAQDHTCALYACLVLLLGLSQDCS